MEEKKKRSYHHDRGRYPTRSIVDKAKWSNENPDDPYVGNLRQSLIIKALESSSGQIAVAAKKLGVTSGTIVKAINKSKKIQEVINDIAEELLDKSEEKLGEQIDKGNLTAIMFHLKCKGRGRGWVDKSDVDINVKPITFKYTVVKDKNVKKDG